MCSMTESDRFDARIEPPNLVVEVSLSPFSGVMFEAKYDLAEVLDIEGEDGDFEVIDSHWHGLIVEGPDGETEHVDLRELNELGE